VAPADGAVQPRTPDPLQHSLNRLRESLRAGADAKPVMAAAVLPTAVLPAAPLDAPVSDPVQRPVEPRPEVPAISQAMSQAMSPALSAPLAQATAPVMPIEAAPLDETPVALIADAPPLDGDGETYDALAEIADEAEASLIRGRPVSILVLSALDGSFAASVADALAHKLKTKSSVVHMAMDASTRTPDHVSGVVRNFSGTHDYVILSAGQADSHSAGLSRAAALTVLVAPEDILDPRGDAASQHLSGCNYFIMGPTVAADEMA
jgi:hypothetical protein